MGEERGPAAQTVFRRTLLVTNRVGYPGLAMLQVLAVIHVILSIALVVLILLHSGRDTGFGGMGFTPASQGGTHIVERNLTRLTVVIGILFFVNTIALFHELK